MPKFKCEYENGYVLSIQNWRLTIEADDHRQAYEKFIEELGLFDHRVSVISGLFEQCQYFEDHIKSEAEKAEEEELKRKYLAEKEELKREKFAKKGCEFLDTKKEDGFFLLETDDKINAQLLFEDIIIPKH